MTNKNYYTSSNYAGRIPNREEFHRYASNLITEADFDTDHSNGIQAAKVFSAIHWTLKNSKKKGVYHYD